MMSGHRLNDSATRMLYDVPVSVARGQCEQGHREHPIRSKDVPASTGTQERPLALYGRCMVVLVPSYVFLEAALAYLRISDPSMPTWGSLVREAFAGDVHGGTYHLVLVPAILLLVMALSFGLLGRALEQSLNPRMRNQ